jgi:multidrug transporter EmrE-like cation transporter
MAGTMGNQKAMTDKDQAWKSFRSLWVAGSLGAFFTALVTNVPLHVHRKDWPCGVVNLGDLLIRYVYLLWFLLYFFVSNLQNEMSLEPNRKRDIIFDLLQSGLSLAAVFFLGFLVPGQNFQVSTAYAAANCAIALICFFSLCFFGRDATADGINGMRIVGLSISGVFAIIAEFGVAPSMDGCSLGFLGGEALLLFALLFMYLGMRIPKT